MAKAKKAAKRQRIRAGKTPSKPKRTSAYETFKAEWERRRAERKAQFAEAQRTEKPDRRDEWESGWTTPDLIKSAAGGGDWLIDKPELLLDAVPFLATLRILGYQLRDERYLDLRRELITSDLIDPKTGKWSRFGANLANPDTQFICAAIEKAIGPGLKEREAIAEAVVELELEAASFPAACQQLRRLLLAYRKTMGQKPRRKRV